MLDRDRVVDLLASAEAYVADVSRFRDALDRPAFLSDRGEQYRIEFPLQQAIQCCVDIAAHLVSSSPGPRPDSLAQLFYVLADREWIDADLAGRLAAMARFRNLLVHEYADIDAARVWDIIHNDLDDLLAFLGRVASALQEG